MWLLLVVDQYHLRYIHSQTIFKLKQKKNKNKKEEKNKKKAFAFDFSIINVGEY